MRTLFEIATEMVRMDAKLMKQRIPMEDRTTVLNSMAVAGAAELLDVIDADFWQKAHLLQDAWYERAARAELAADQVLRDFASNTAPSSQ